MSEKEDRFDGHPVDSIIGELLGAEDTIARLKAENEELKRAYNSMQDSNAKKAESADWYKAQNKELVGALKKIVAASDAHNSCHLLRVFP